MLLYINASINCFRQKQSYLRVQSKHWGQALKFNITCLQNASTTMRAHYYRYPLAVPRLLPQPPSRATLTTTATSFITTMRIVLSAIIQKTEPQSCMFLRWRRISDRAATNESLRTRQVQSFSQLRRLQIVGMCRHKLACGVIWLIQDVHKQETLADLKDFKLCRWHLFGLS